MPGVDMKGTRRAAGGKWATLDWILSSAQPSEARSPAHASNSDHCPVLATVPMRLRPRHAVANWVYAGDGQEERIMRALSRTRWPLVPFVQLRRIPAEVLDRRRKRERYDHILRRALAAIQDAGGSTE